MDQLAGPNRPRLRLRQAGKRDIGGTDEVWLEGQREVYPAGLPRDMRDRPGGPYEVEAGKLWCANALLLLLPKHLRTHISTYHQHPQGKEK